MKVKSLREDYQKSDITKLAKAVKIGLGEAEVFLMLFKNYDEAQKFASFQNKKYVGLLIRQPKTKKLWLVINGATFVFFTLLYMYSMAKLFEGEYIYVLIIGLYALWLFNILRDFIARNRVMWHRMD